MANAFAALTVELNAQLAPLRRSMNEAVTIARDAKRKVDSALSVGGAAKTGAAFFAGQLGLQSVLDSITTVKDLSDEWTRIRVLVQNVTSSIGEAERAQRSLYEAAQATRQNFGELTRSFASFARNADELNITSDKAVELQTTIAQAIALSGARADSAASALVQFGQGIAAGVLRGEELNSVLEQTPKLAKAIADGMEVPIGTLIKMGKEGELTADRIIAALTKVAPQIQREFDKVTPTIADSFVALTNALGNVINRFNEILPIASALSRIILTTAAALDKVVEFSRLDPQAANRNAGSLNDLATTRAQTALDALNNPSNPNYNPNLSDAVRQRLREFNELQINRAANARAALADAQAARGLNPDGSVLRDNVIANARSVDQADKARAKAAEAAGEVIAQINGISKAFEKQAAVLREAFEKGVYGPTNDPKAIASYERDVRTLMEKSGFFPKERKAKQEGDPIGDLATRALEQERDRVEKLREEVLRTIDPFRELRQELETIDQLRRAGDISPSEAALAVQANEIKQFEKLKELLPSYSEEQLRATKALDDWIAAQRLEIDLMNEIEPYRDTAVQMRALEAAGIKKGTEEWTRYRDAVLEVARAREVARINSESETAKQLKTQATLQLLITDFESQLAKLSDAGPVDPERLRELQSVLSEQFTTVLGLADKLKEVKEPLKDIFQPMISQMERVIFEGGKIKDLLKSIAIDAGRVLFRQQITAPLGDALSGTASSLFGGQTLFGAVASLFAPRAVGGPVNRGSGYLVGERGPELFVPRQNGTIVSNQALKGGGSTTMVFDFRGAVAQVDLVREAAYQGAMLARADRIEEAWRGGLRGG